VLTLVPGLLECASVCVIFILRFQRFELSLVVFVGILLYVYVTRTITLKRKRIRKGVNKQDNVCHQLATDTIGNFEVRIGRF
jgi:ABC-type transport system involved in Fe-S cluster assembly fused permease/ATPase subunit